ncbi:hypothetical protein GALMADRAFT_154420 [Galerina marginata CBS 339.88]|uniref:Uncharacterized protein n=1 Tax=Galerina marginata (strain CBS 339.88) TaxID=685588 RepID=A0A067TB45_GALM3|nr:hypothetical protein GALMADRAFT_154420 [Galerina marginata CBS 339.88]
MAGEMGDGGDLVGTYVNSGHIAPSANSFSRVEGTREIMGIIRYFELSLDMDAEDLGLEEECDDSDEDVASESDDDKTAGDDEQGLDNIFMGI